MVVAVPERLVVNARGSHHIGSEEPTGGEPDKRNRCCVTVISPVSSEISKKIMGYPVSLNHERINNAIGLCDTADTASHKSYLK